MNMKKALSGLCAGALALSLSIPAFADLGTTYTADNDIDGADIGTVSVTTPVTTGSLYINETGAPYALKDDTTSVSGMTIKGTTATEGFFTTPAMLVNTGDSALKVSVTVTSKATNLVIASTVTGSESTNTIAGNLEVKSVTPSGTNLTVDWTNAETLAIPTATDTDGSGTAGTAATKTFTAPLPAAGKDDMDRTVNGYLAYRLAGDIKLGAAGWNDSDVEVKVVFTLEPAT